MSQQPPNPPPPDLILVGAGILGAALAERLTAAGARPTLLDAAPAPCRGASRHSEAWINSNDKTPRPYHALNVAGLRAWAATAARLGPAGAWYHPVGNLEWAEDPDARAALLARVQRLRSWGYAARLVGRDEALGLEPSLRLPDTVRDAAWFPDEGYLRTEPLVRRLLEAAAARGAEVLLGDAGRVLAVTPGGGAAGPRPAVRTADGRTRTADAVVLCAGRWTPELAATAGARVPLVDPAGADTVAPEAVAVVGPVARPLVRVLHTPEVGLRPAGPDTVQLIAASSLTLGASGAALDAWAAELLARARRVVPDLNGAAVLSRTVCVRPLPVDGRPIVGRLPGAPGVHALVTHSGVTLAAHLAELAARDLLAPGSAGESRALAPYRPTRFRRT